MASKLPRLVTQPKFAEQIQTVSSPLGINVPLQRGYMIWAKPMPKFYSGGGPLGDGRDMIHFMFNPSTVSTQYSVGNASLQAAMMYQVPGDAGNLVSPLLQQSASWDLYFDRTYELNYGGASSAVNDPAVIGVQADVYAFLQFTGLLVTLDRAEAQSILGGSGSSTMSTTTGIMMLVPCWVYFGNALQQMNQNASSANFNALASQLNYYGYISGFSVQYTHWTANMVPIRAVISVNFNMLANPAPAVQKAVWRDLQKLGTQPYSTIPPFVNGYTPPPNFWNLKG